MDKSTALEIATAKSKVVILLIDVINDFDFVGGNELLERALPAAKNIAALKGEASRLGIPTIYVNDNFGRWQSDFRSQVERCLADNCPGCKVAEMLIPSDNDYFVLKPMHSAFYSTALAVLLERLGAEVLVLAGFASNICVLFTAHDAHMRNFHVVVPTDCSAAETDDAHHFAIEQLRLVIKADTRPSTEIDLTELKPRSKD